MTPPPPVSLRVPATSANLGPGFDCLGLAVDLWLRVTVAPAEQDRFSYRGPGRVAASPDNLVHRGFAAGCRAAGRPAFPVEVTAVNEIPLARGLGSSSAALVAGVASADLLLGGPLGRDGVFALAAELEGHPDNVAPAVYGGFTVSTPHEGGYLTSGARLPDGWRLLFGVPAFESSTREARRLLPGSYPTSDVVATAGRAALWALAVSLDRPELLRAATRDALHQPYRAPHLPGFDRCCTEALARGAYGVFLSGAGPTVGAVSPPEAVPGCREALARYAGPAGQVLELAGAAGYESAPVAST